MKRIFWLLLVTGLLVLLWLLNRQKSSPPQPQTPPISRAKSTDNQISIKEKPPVGAPRVSADLLLASGMIKPESDARFSRLPASDSSKIIYVQKATQAALVKMMDAARSDGIDLKVISGFRSYGEQKAIWQRKWDANAGQDDLNRVNQILKFSSMPGISRHHWGTDVDFNSLELSYWRTEKGAKTQQWLRQNAASFGFCEPYSGKAQGKRSGGYEDEAWHWSYRAIALQLQNLRSANMDNILHQPLTGQKVVLNMPERMRAYVTSVAASCQ
jgi:LAS superfamily LD-carboxypeptidase LdcB